MVFRSAFIWIRACFWTSMSNGYVLYDLLMASVNGRNVPGQPFPDERAYVQSVTSCASCLFCSANGFLFLSQPTKSNRYNFFCWCSQELNTCAFISRWSCLKFIISLRYFHFSKGFSSLVVFRVCLKKFLFFFSLFIIYHSSLLFSNILCIFLFFLVFRIY